MKVYKVADIVNNEVVFCVARGWKQGDLTVILTNLQPVNEPKPDSVWQLEMLIGEGPTARRVMLDLPPLLSAHDSLNSPLFLAENQLVFYCDRLFMPERPPKRAVEREEIILRTKKLVYDEQADLASLKAAVANLEAAIEYTKSGPKRDPIPEDVKLLVWARDGGACVRCGAKIELHFDHIIPVAKGGGNVEANIQILCQPCNLKKADKIATP
jgi:HNH endonuclease